MNSASRCRWFMRLVRDARKHFNLTDRERSLDSGIKRRLALGFASNWVGKLASTITQLVQVPVFFHFWATSVYGDWLIVNTIPTYLAFSSIGFGNVASNEMTMLNSAGDREGALRVFQSCWRLIRRSAAVGLFSPILTWSPPRACSTSTPSASPTPSGPSFTSVFPFCSANWSSR